jgi:hypothetical protein
MRSKPEGRLFDPLVVRRFAPNNQRILLIRSVVEARSVLDNNEFSGLAAGTTGWAVIGLTSIP